MQEKEGVEKDGDDDQVQKVKYSTGFDVNGDDINLDSAKKILKTRKVNSLFPSRKPIS